MISRRYQNVTWEGFKHTEVIIVGIRRGKKIIGNKQRKYKENKM